MSTTAWLVVGALGALVGMLLVTVGALRGRVHRVATRLDALERHVGRDLVADVEAARAEARNAVAIARRAAGDVEPPPKIAFEPVTGRLVRAVAFGAGARRAIARFARRDVERRAS